ncbi:hypothetical protein D3C87_2104360 [compost metagenome]
MGGQATVQNEQLVAGERHLIRRQPGRQIGDIMRFAEAPDRVLRDHRLFGLDRVCLALQVGVHHLGAQ